MQVQGIARLFEPLIQRQFRRDVTRNFQRLREILEDKRSAGEEAGRE
jgi:hypothetical protein